MQNEEKKKIEIPVKVPPLPADRPVITPDEMYQIGRVFAERIFSDERVAPRLKKVNMIINFKYYDPDRWEEVVPEITVDLTGDDVKLYTGPTELQPTVIMWMHADTAHRFWMNKVNLMVAITKGEIKAKGPISQIMRLLPTIKPSFEIYREVLKELGFIDLLNYPKEEKKE